MSTQFEFRLLGGEAPQGELDADHLLAIVASLKDIATRVGRAETDAEPIGRAPKRTQRLAKLTIGLAPGSTKVLARRATVDDALDFDLPDEAAFDQRVADLIDSIAADRRPAWVGDSLSSAASGLVAALQQAAPEVEFTVDGQVRQRFRTDDIHREAWQASPTTTSDIVTFTGRLYAVNLLTHRLQVRDDVGHRFGLPKVRDDADLSKLLGTHVTVTGTPEFDPDGGLSQIRDATIAAAPEPLDDAAVPDATSLEDILESAPGPEFDSGLELTDEEFDSFFEAMGL